MTNKPAFITQTEALFNRLSTFQIAVLFTLITIIVRFPFWFLDVINWDETTFVIMARSILDGHLLYTDLWDIKPPLAFYNVAAFSLLFGETAFTARVIGAVCVALSAFFVFMIIRKITTKTAAFIFSLAVIFMLSRFWNAQSLFTEHMALVPLLFAAFLTIDKETISLKRAALIGLLISAAVLVRLNLGYVAVFAGFLMLFYSEQKTLLGRITTGAVYGIAGLVPVILLIVLYGSHGELEIFYKTVVAAPLSYSGQSPIMDSFSDLGWQLIKPEKNIKFIIANMALVGALLIVIRNTKLSVQFDKLIKVLVLSVSVFYSIIASGGGHYHYLLQVVPFLAVLAAITSEFLAKWPMARTVVLVGIVAATLVNTVYSAKEYHKLVNRISSGETAFYGPSFWAAEKIKEQNVCDYSVYALSYHAVYLHLDKQPPTPLATHPSNIAWEFHVSTFYGDETVKPVDELRLILDGKPTFILKRTTETHIEQYPELKELYMERLASDYTLLDSKGNLKQYNPLLSEQEQLGIYMLNNTQTGNVACN